MPNDGWGKEWPVLSQKHKDQIKEFKEKVVGSVTISEGIFKDAAFHGIGFSQDGNHIPLEKIYIDLKNDAAKEDWGRPNAQWPTSGTAINQIWQNDQAIARAKQQNLKSQGSNLVDDEAYLYFQCESCQDILDPHTKSFKVLQERRANAKWKCIWNTNGLGYKVYCPKCGDGK